MYYVSMDIGGSAIKAGIVNSEGELLEKMHVITPKTNLDDLCEALSGIVSWGSKLAKIEGVAFSYPCVTDSETGQALSEGALGYIKDTNPARIIGEKFNLPYAAENDGNCAALAEVWTGRAREVRSMALVVCGSGIGGGLIKEKKVINGYRKFAGEFGMSIITFKADGTPVPWSACGSTLALVNDYATRTGKEAADLNGKIIFELAEHGDRVAQACIDQFFRFFAYGIHNIQHIFDPELTLVGGAISSRTDFIERIESELDILYSQMYGVMSRPTVAICTSGPDANLIGAVYHLIGRMRV